MGDGCGGEDSISQAYLVIMPPGAKPNILMYFWLCQFTWAAGRFCGDTRSHWLEPWHFNHMCASGLLVHQSWSSTWSSCMLPWPNLSLFSCLLAGVCNYRCKSFYCPNCDDGNCRCVEPVESGEVSVLSNLSMRCIHVVLLLLSLWRALLCWTETLKDLCACAHVMYGTSVVRRRHQQTA